jgi:hypothetical protein
LPASGPVASSSAATTSQATPISTWRRSDAAARSSRLAASPSKARRGGGVDAKPWVASESSGIEA